MDLSPDMAAALAQHQAGDLAQAEAGYRRILAGRPTDTAATYLLTMLMLQRLAAPLSEVLDLLDRLFEAPTEVQAQIAGIGAILDQTLQLERAVGAIARAAQLDASCANAASPGAAVPVRLEKLLQSALAEHVGAMRARGAEPDERMAFLNDLLTSAAERTDGGFLGERLSKIVAPEITDLPVREIDEYENFFEDNVKLRVGTEIQGYCSIGAHTEINGATLYPRTTVGRYCSIARGAAVGAPSHPIHCLGTSLALELTNAALKLKATTIGHDVWIGANAVILAGVTVGPGAVIGAGAIITRDVEPYSIVVGNPGRVIRSRFSPHICEQLLALKWWNLDHDRVAGLPHDDIELCIDMLKQLSASGQLVEGA